MNTQVNTQPATDTLKTMIVLTPLASQKIQALMTEKNLEGYGLRVFVAGVGCSGLQYGLAFENNAEEGDFVFESQGTRVYLDAQSALYLDGATVDYIEGPQGSGFKIENPNEVSGCSSCGSEGSCCGH